MGKGKKPTYRHSTFIFECGLCGQQKSFSNEKEMRHAKIRHNKIVHKTDNIEIDNSPLTHRRKSLEYGKEVVKQSDIIIRD